MTTTVYKTGNVTVTSSNATVSGSGTAWSLALVTGGVFSCLGLSIPIEEVVSDTELTLAYPWPGITSPGAAYAIARETSQAVRAAWIADRLATIISKFSLTGVAPNGAGTIAERDALTLGPDDKGFLWGYVEWPNDLAIYYWNSTSWDGPFPLRGEGEPSLAQSITTSGLQDLADDDLIVPGKSYFVTDQGRWAFGVGTDAYHIMPKVTVSTTAPSSPAIDDIWIDKS